MLERSAREILERLEDSDLVLDVGGWAKPFPRADWVLDLMPYETRGLYGYEGPRDTERFREDTWVRADICSHEPWPFADDQFDFAICAHTLEDVRDPIRVCEELARVAKAGYIEVPSRLEEQSYGIQGPWVGWGHHRWLIDARDSRLEFVMKHHVLHGRAEDHFSFQFHERLSEEDKVLRFWWQEGFEAEEVVMIGDEQLDPYLRALVAEREPVKPRGPGLAARAMAKLRR